MVHQILVVVQLLCHNEMASKSQHGKPQVTYLRKGQYLGQLLT